jgi:methionine-rich copper-binding protein CopC
MRLATLVCAVLLALLLAVAALAHRRSDIFIKSEPADGAVVQQSPAQVVIWFNTELATGPSRLQVFAADKRQVDNGGGGVDLHDPDHASLLVRLPALPDGVYTVRWRAVVFADGDSVEGRFTFTVSGKR